MAASDALSSAGSGAAAGSVFGPWGTVIGGAVGLASSFLGSGTKTDNVAPNVYNMYGQANTPNTGAINSMNGVFGQINGQGFQNNVNGATNNYVGSLNSAATNPGLASIYNYAQGELNGNNLQNPLVTNYANQAYQSQIAQGANNAARTRAAYSRAGLGFSTGNQQAADADMAAASASGNLARSGILSQNEQFERGLQQQAPGMLAGAISAPSGFLGQIPGAYYAPLQAQSGITSQLAGGSQVSQPTLLQQPNFSQQLASGVSTGTGLASLFNSAGQPAQKSPNGPQMTYDQYQQLYGQP